MNYNNISALTKGGRSYGFFDSLKPKNGGGLDPKEHDRRLQLREEAYEMRRQRGQARNAQDRQAASDQAFQDRRREASVKIGEDIARLQALHPVKLQLDRATHAQELVKKADFHQQALGFEGDRASVRLDATKATDAHKLQHEVRRVRTMHGVKSQLTDDTHIQRLGHRADTQRQDLTHRDQAHSQRLTQFEDQVAAGIRRRIGPSNSVKTPKTAAPIAPTAAQPSAAPAASPATMPHPSPRVQPRRKASQPGPAKQSGPAAQPSAPAAQPSQQTPAAPTVKRPSPESSPEPASRPASQASAPGDGPHAPEPPASAARSRKARSSFDTRPDTKAAPTPPTAESAQPIRTRKKRASTSAPSNATPSSTPAASMRLPQASTSIKLPGSEMHEHVSGRFSWDKRTVRDKLKTQLPGERVETRDESSARIKRRQALKP
jgi:hypothetical protein